jgi:hypothetical protein
MKGATTMKNYYREYQNQELSDALVLAELEAEAEAEVEAELAEELAEDIRQGMEYARTMGDWDLYSDLYKDYFGVRPRSW